MKLIEGVEMFVRGVVHGRFTGQTPLAGETGSPVLKIAIVLP
jgi:hypothetical protein